MWKYFTAKNTLKYIDVLQKLVYSRHRSVGMKPADANRKNESVLLSEKSELDLSENQNLIYLLFLQLR